MAHETPTESMARFEAEDDARTLARAAAIGSDADRMKAAQKAAKTLFKEDKDRAEMAEKSSKALEKLAKGNLTIRVKKR